jgi:hypothetical protein
MPSPNPTPDTTRVRGASPGSVFSNLFILVVGLGLALVFAAVCAHERRIATVYRETTCTVLARRAGHGKNAAAAYVDVSLVVDGHDIKATSVSISSPEDVGLFPPKRAVPCFYDPDKPSAVEVLRPTNYGLGWLLYTLLFSGIPITIGIRGLLRDVHHVGKSPEAVRAELDMARANRRPASARGSPYRAAPQPRSPTDLDGLPIPKVITVRGESLPVRLVRGMPRLRELGGLGVFTILWTAGVCIGIAYELRANEVILGLVLIPCALIDAALVSSLVKHTRLYAIREPILELDAHPLRQGSVRTLSITQRGPLDGATIEVELQGTELATTIHADSSTKRFLTQKILEESPDPVERGERWTRNVEVFVPRDIPSSFAAQFGAIRYEIVVRTATAAMSAVDENRYPVLVLPVPGDVDG